MRNVRRTKGEATLKIGSDIEVASAAGLLGMDTSKEKVSFDTSKNTPISNKRKNCCTEKAGGVDFFFPYGWLDKEEFFGKKRERATNETIYRVESAVGFSTRDLIQIGMLLKP